MRKVRESLYFVIYALGILISYLLNGLLVESISKMKGFKYYLSILFLPVLFNCGFAFLIVILKRQNVASFTRGNMSQQTSSSIVNFTDSKAMQICAFCSGFYVAGMFFSNASLGYVTYPMQIIGKSAKPIPVMIFSIIGAGCQYSKKKYLTVLLVVVGTATFLYSKDDDGQKTNEIGIICLLLSLLSDGIVALFQEKIRKLGPVDSFDLMLAINTWAGLLIGVIVVLSGELVDFFYFCVQDLGFFLQLFLLGITSCLGQTFIFLTVCHYGPLVCSLITTSRKFFAVLLSIAVFEHKLSLSKWVSMIAVFSGLALEAAFPK